MTLRHVPSSKPRYDTMSHGLLTAFVPRPHCRASSAGGLHKILRAMLPSHVYQLVIAQQRHPNLSLGLPSFCPTLTSDPPRPPPPRNVLLGKTTQYHVWTGDKLLSVRLVMLEITEDLSDGSMDRQFLCTRWWFVAANRNLRRCSCMQARRSTRPPTRELLPSTRPHPLCSMTLS